MTAKLPLDDNGYPIPAMAYKPGSAVSKSPSGNAVLFGPFDPTTKLITVRSSAAVNFETGSDTVTATSNSHYMAADQDYDIPLKGRQYLAVYGTATVYVSERE